MKLVEDRCYVALLLIFRFLVFFISGEICYIYFNSYFNRDF